MSNKFITLVLFAASLSVQHASAELIIGLTTTNALIRFDSATPGTTFSAVSVSGLQSGETLLGIDYRPATGALYGVGSSSRLYTLNTATGFATQVGSGAFGALSGTDFGVDFNPVVDRLRIVSNTGQNLRVNPDTGALAGTDTPLNPGTPSVVGSAYTNNFAGTLVTTLFGIDSLTDSLVRQGGVDGPPSPNGGTLTTIGPLGFNTSDLVGFDISGASAIAFASLTPAVGGSSSLFTINLSTGASTLIGTIGGGASLRDISVVSVAAVPEPTTLGLLASGLAAVFVLRRKRSLKRR